MANHMTPHVICQIIYNLHQKQKVLQKSFLIRIFRVVLSKYARKYEYINALKC